MPHTRYTAGFPFTAKMMPTMQAASVIRVNLLGDWIRLADLLSEMYLSSSLYLNSLSAAVLTRMEASKVLGSMSLLMDTLAVTNGIIIETITIAAKRIARILHIPMPNISSPLPLPLETGIEE